MAQKPEGRVNHVNIWGGGASQAAEQRVQRSWGSIRPDVLEKQQGGLCGQSRGARGREGGGESREGTG